MEDDWLEAAYEDRFTSDADEQETPHLDEDEDEPEVVDRLATLLLNREG